MVDYTSYATQAAQKYGLNPSYLTATAAMEGTPNNIFGFQGSAASAFGFRSGADFLDIGKQFDSGAAYAKQNASALGSKLGRAPTDFETYLAHWQGSTGAFNILSNPDAPAERTVQNYFRNGGTSLPAGATNQDWINAAKKRWTSAGGSLGESEGILAPPKGLSVIDQSKVTAPADSGGGGWADYIVHQGVRGGVFFLGVVFVGMGLIVFTFGGVRENVNVYREFRRGREVAKAGAAKVDVTATGGTAHARGGTVHVSSRGGRKRGSGAPASPKPKPKGPNAAAQQHGAKPHSGNKSMRMLRDVVKKHKKTA